MIFIHLQEAYQKNTTYLMVVLRKRWRSTSFVHITYAVFRNWRSLINKVPIVYCRWFRSFIDNNVHRVFSLMMHGFILVDTSVVKIPETFHPKINTTKIKNLYAVRKLEFSVRVSRSWTVVSIFFETTVNCVFYQYKITKFIVMLEKD